MKQHRRSSQASTLAIVCSFAALTATACERAQETQYTTQQRESAATVPTPQPPESEASDGLSPAVFLGIRAHMPATWREVPPQSPMHHTTFDVPPAAEGENAQIVVFFFGRGQGGPIDANIQRWEQQFRSPTGGDVKADVKRFDANGLPITLVELEGEYQSFGAMTYTPEQHFVTAIVDAPRDQRIFIRFVGDAATVLAHREAFVAMIEGLQWIGE